MNTDQPSPKPIHPPPPPKRKPKSKRRHLSGLVNWVVGILVLLVLIGVSLPTTGRLGVRGRQVQALSRAKSIGLALGLFAHDNDGYYPRAGLPAMPAARVTNSNEAFAMLFPTYVTSETLFGNPLSAYQTRPPDNVYDALYTGRPIHTLEPGENVFAYVTGLTDTGNPATPLLADGTDGTGHYTTDPLARGGVWEGKKSVVVRLDDSAELETLAGPEHSRYIPRHPGEPGRDGGNLLDVSGLGPGVRLLDPAVRSDPPPMNPDSELPSATPSPADPRLAPRSRRRYIPGLWGCLLMLVVLAVLGVFAMRYFNRTVAKSDYTLALMHAKQIATGLRTFASDSEGNFPRAGLPDMLGAEPKDSNAAFAVLFPEYLSDESIFGNELSVYQTRPPDSVCDNPYTGHPDKTLAPGENVYSYVAGLTMKSPPDSPLVADGTDGTGHYVTDPKKRGGAWKGKWAIVCRVDGSGAIENLAGPDDTRYIPRRAGDKANLLDVAGLGGDVRLLDPAIDGGGGKR